MTRTPEDFAVPPASHGSTRQHVDARPPLDLLSGVIRNVRLRSKDIFCCGPVAPFAISFDHPGGTIHIVEQGALELQLVGERSGRRYEEGDLVLLPTGKPHVVRHGTRVPARPLAASDVSHEVVKDFARTRWLTGTFSFEDSPGVQMLYSLPPLIELRGAGKSDVFTWFDASALCFAREWTLPSQGSAEILSRLLELLFLFALREAAERPDAAPGWLTGATDPVISEAITAVHAEPRLPWTVERLAAKSHLSRSAFAERFARRVGRPPAAYVSQVRLERARDLLECTTEPISLVAKEVGYQSEAAFSRAFSKRYNVSPSNWRYRSVRPGATSLVEQRSTTNNRV
jgi:AraC-like DNA-binding protein